MKLQHVAISVITLGLIIVFGSLAVDYWFCVPLGKTIEICTELIIEHRLLVPLSWLDWMQAGGSVLVLSGSILLLIEGGRKERRDFLARTGLAASDARVVAAYQRLTPTGRAQVKSAKDLDALLARRAVLDEERRQEAARKAALKSERRLFYESPAW